MFMKKLVEKASKKAGGFFEGLDSSDVEPHIVFHYGIASGSTKFAYDSIQKILAVSTKNGQLNLFGKENSQAILESEEISPSKFLQFFENQGILLNVTPKNQIQVWDIEKKILSCTYTVNEDITAFTVMPHCSYMYAGDSAGNISILQLNQEQCNMSQMNYRIRFAVSHGNSPELSVNAAVTQILPQPMAESKRVLIIYEDGIITLWEIWVSRSIFSAGGNVLPSLTQDRKKVTSATWVCPLGSKVAVGYSSGDIFIWSIPTRNGNTELATDSGTQSPLCKLNLGYKLEKNPIVSLKWVYADGKASRLYVIGASNDTSASSLQVVLLNEHMESRIVKMVVQLPEPCITMELISSSTGQSKHKEESLLVLGKSGSIYAYDDGSIEKYLLQTQSRSSAVLPKENKAKVPLPDSSITVALFVTNNQDLLMSEDEQYIQLAKKYPSLLLSGKNAKDGIHPYLNTFGGLTKIRNLYITGHSNGAINFWDISCPLLFPLVSLEPQVQGDSISSGLAISALYFEAKSHLLVFGDKNGSVHICKLKADPQISGSMKSGNTHVIESAKVTKISGEVLSININPSSSHLAVGSDQGYVSLIKMEGPTELFTKHIASEISAGILSLQFGTCSLHGFEKTVLVISTRDSSLLALDCDTGNTMSSSLVHPKKPSKALFMEILDEQSSLDGGPKTLSNSNISKQNLAEDIGSKQEMLLLCSEKAVYVYSLPHLVQGIKKVIHKRKFHSSSCCWASTFYAPYIGLILIFIGGKVEIRSLPELSLVKEGLIRGFVNTNANSNTTSAYLISSSQDGQLLMVNGDQEILAFSVVPENHYRLLDFFGQVYRRDPILPREGLASTTINYKEKKKGLFSSVFKDTKGSREKHMPDVDREDPSETIQELSVIFSTFNFPTDAEDRGCVKSASENKDNLTEIEDNCDLDIDDINLDDIELDGIGEKPRGQNKFPGISTKKWASKLQNIKGKMTHTKVKNEKSIPKEEPQDEKIGSVDQIKRKYGFGPSGETGSIAKMAENKLQDNIRKLQGINIKATQMQDTAKSFSSMAKELLRTVEQDKRNI